MTDHLVCISVGSQISGLKTAYYVRQVLWVFFKKIYMVMYNLCFSIINMFKGLGLITYLDEISNNPSKFVLTFENSIFNP